MKHEHEHAALIARDGELLAVIPIADGQPPDHIEHDGNHFAFRAAVTRNQDQDEWDYEYHEHRHAEAFALMRYAAPGKSVMAWNSRDGVTPFIINHHGTELTHVDWDSDRYDPGYVPPLGDVVFIDLTYRLAQKLADDFMDANWETMRQQPEYADLGRNEVRQRMAGRYVREASNGAPYHLEVTREFQHALVHLTGDTLRNSEGDAKWGQARWWWNPDDPYYTCSHCGSVHPAALLEILITSGAHYSGSDWKYGYPHKFYFDLPENSLWDGSPKWHGKFYTRHLQELTDRELDPIAELILKHLGIGFYREDNKIIWRAARGTQRWGDIP